MASGHPGDAVRQINRLFRDGTAAALTDGQLLERFAARRPEAAESAFEALVTRHGPMVMRVCRGVLRDPRDVEDAFQATFLVLVRKANSIGERDLLGPWLYGVAHRVALKARGVAAKRNKREGGIMDDPPADAAEGPWLDLRPILHEELDRLPEKYRKPVILCHLQGLTHAEAAQELAWPVGTVSVRLARARKLLKERLTRRGLTATAPLWAAGLTLEGASAAVPESLIRSTAKAALQFATGKGLVAGAASVGTIALTKRTLSMMLISRLKWLAIPLALGLGAAGGVVGMKMISPKPATDSIPPPENGSATNPFATAEAENVGGGIATAEQSKNRTNLDPIPPDFFDISELATKDDSGPPVVRVGQILAVEVLEALPGRPITGERVVRPDGTISLGFYGDLHVAGLNRNQIKVKLLEHLTKFINDETLGLMNFNPRTTKSDPVKPMETSRVFVDESANYLPEGAEKVSRPRVRGESFGFKDSIRNGRLDVLEGWIHRVVKEMGEVKAALQSTKVADSQEPGVSDAEHMRRIDAEVERKGHMDRINFLIGELYKALKELEGIRAEERPADAKPSGSAKPAAPATATPPATSPG